MTVIGGGAPYVVPKHYEQLIEGQPAGEDAYPGFIAGLHLQRNWPDDFGKHLFFRVMGTAHATDQNDFSLRTADLKSFWTGCHARMVNLIPDGWEDRHFASSFALSLRQNQVGDAVGAALQRFDRAALCILFLQAVLEHKKIDWPLYRYVRLRPVTYYIEGFKEVFAQVRSNTGVINELLAQTGQSLAVLEKMADGGWFVTRKTADLALRTLRELASRQVIDPGILVGLEVRCGRSNKRSRPERNIWPVKEERPLYVPDEYLSPSAWEQIPPADRAAVQLPPFRIDGRGAANV